MFQFGTNVFSDMHSWWLYPHHTRLQLEGLGWQLHPKHNRTYIVRLTQSQWTKHPIIWRPICNPTTENKQSDLWCFILWDCTFLCKFSVCCLFVLNRGWLSFIQLQAYKFLHALPVLHLGRAVGVILTWLAVGPLRLSHFLIHLGQTQSGEQV